MTAGRLAGDRARPFPSGDLARTAVVLAALGAVVVLRWAGILAGRLDGVTIGALFGVGLMAVASGARRLAGSVPGNGPRRHAAVDLAVGLTGGAILIGLALLASTGTASTVPSPGSTGLGDERFMPWLAATIVVALAEEAILRGALFSMLERATGPLSAVLATSVAFALMHVPVYGWHVVPLDLGVGIFLGGLRLATGRWLAPGIAHLAADVATWWL